jgi:hypothetical protein
MMKEGASGYLVCAVSLSIAIFAGYASRLWIERPFLGRSRCLFADRSLVDGFSGACPEVRVHLTWPAH